MALMPEPCRIYARLGCNVRAQKARAQKKAEAEGGRHCMGAALVVQSKLASTIRVVRPAISLYQRYCCIQYLYVKYTQIQD